MIRASRLLMLFVLVCLFSVSSVAAQITEVTCRAIFRAAVEGAVESCASLGNDAICYAHAPASAVPLDDASAFTFDQPGDMVSVDTLQSLQTQLLDFEESEYGIVIANLHVGIRDDSTENTTLVLFGDTQVTNAIGESVNMAMRVNSGINVRLGPGAAEGLAGSLSVGAVVTATGRATNAAGEEWIRIDFQEHRDRIGWVIGWALDSDEDRSQLPEVQPTDRILKPMQSLMFQTGRLDTPCLPASDSGALMQSPAGAGPLLFFLHDALLELDGTIFLQASADTLDVSTLAGDVKITAGGVRQIVPIGAMTHLALDANGLVTTQADFPEGYDLATLDRLPYTLLPAPVDLIDPLSPSEVVEALSPDFPESGTWVVSGEPAACFPNSSSPAVVSSDHFLGTGSLTFAPDNVAFTFVGGPGGTSTHTLVAPDTYSFSVTIDKGTTTFTTRVIDPETLVTDVAFSFIDGGGNCTSSATWTWSRLGD